MPIEFDFDLERRRARISFGGDEVLTTTEPVKSMATGKDHRVHLDMPESMEDRHPETATTGVLRSKAQLHSSVHPTIVRWPSLNKHKPG